ncbi:RES domain-containing protein [Tsukamurella strandjordii]|uniref:RES domain-containing protein n=1 Tax=Tsukamurella strandjordii TaxID=147577 RepID=UPI0031D6EB83
MYRTFPHLPTALPGDSGHWSYLHRPQGRGRLDNPDLYDTWYFALTPEAAVGETFGDLPRWGSAMFEFPHLVGAKRVLGVFEVPDDSRLLDLDDANALVDRALRPTQVIVRNRSTSQGWARKIYGERSASRDRVWDGVRWWSFHRAQWTVVALWAPPGSAAPYSCVRVEDLSTDHPAVLDAARALGRQVV